MSTILIIIVIIIIFVVLIIIFKEKLKKARLKIFGIELGIETHPNIPIPNQSHSDLGDNVAGDKIIYNPSKENTLNPKEKIKDKKDTLPIIVYPGYANGVLADRYHKCSKCKFGFMVKSIDNSTSTMATAKNYLDFNIFGNMTVTCPECGNTDIL